MSRQILLAPILLLHSPFTWSFKKYSLNDGDMRHKTKCCPQNYCSPDRYWLLRTVAFAAWLDRARHAATRMVPLQEESWHKDAQRIDRWEPPKNLLSTPSTMSTPFQIFQVSKYLQISPNVSDSLKTGHSLPPSVHFGPFRSYWTSGFPWAPCCWRCFQCQRHISFWRQRACRACILQSIDSWLEPWPRHVSAKRCQDVPSTDVPDPTPYPDSRGTHLIPIFLKASESKLSHVIVMSLSCLNAANLQSAWDVLTCTGLRKPTIYCTKVAKAFQCTSKQSFPRHWALLHPNEAGVQIPDHFLFMLSPLHST
jgi:hypothetical protein